MEQDETTEPNELTIGVCLFDEEFRLVGANQAGRDYLDLFGPFEAGERILRLGAMDLRDVSSRGTDNRLVFEGPPPKVFHVEVSTDDTGNQRIVTLRDTTLEHQRQVRAQEQDRLAAMGQMAAGVAHDFNNMLTVTIGYAEVLRMSQDIPSRTKEMLEEIITHGHRAEQLIAQILDFSRQRIARRQAVYLTPFLKETLKLLRRSLPASVELDVALDDGRHVVNANLTQIQQVILNLALNARDAMPDGGTLTVGLSKIQVGPEEGKVIRSVRSPYGQDLPSGDWTVLSVSDTGTGIPPEALPRIYDPFYTTKDPGKGTGLGLSQVYGIVKQHEGFIEIDTSEQGSTFSVYFPASDAQASDTGPSSSGIPLGAGETVLVVEDHRPVQNVVKAMLQQLGYETLLASNGIEAVELFDRLKDTIDLVLTDVVMPEMGGLGVVAHVRGVSDVPVLLMSGHMLNEEGEAVQRLGIEGHLKKPVTITELAQGVRRSLNRKQDG